MLGCCVVVVTRVELTDGSDVAIAVVVSVGCGLGWSSDTTCTSAQFQNSSAHWPEF